METEPDTEKGPGCPSCKDTLCIIVAAAAAAVAAAAAAASCGRGFLSPLEVNIAHWGNIADAIWGQLCGEYNFNDKHYAA